MTVSPDSKYIVSGSADQSIKVFDLDTKQQVYHFVNAHESKFIFNEKGIISHV